MWRCELCEVWNEDDQKKCVVCGYTKEEQVLMKLEYARLAMVSKRTQNEEPVSYTPTRPSYPIKELENGNEEYLERKEAVSFRKDFLLPISILAISLLLVFCIAWLIG